MVLQGVGEIKRLFSFVPSLLVHILLNTLSLSSITLNYTESQNLMYSHCLLTTGCGSISRVVYNKEFMFTGFHRQYIRVVPY